MLKRVVCSISSLGLRFSMATAEEQRDLTCLSDPHERQADPDGRHRLPPDPRIPSHSLCGHTSEPL